LNQELITYHIVVTALVGVMLFTKNLRVRRCKLDQDEIWRDCSSSKYALTDWVRFFNHK